MGPILLAVWFLSWSSQTGGQEFRRMPDLRGQSFGLENFLIQPFNLAAQAEDGQIQPKRRDRYHVKNPFAVEFQVKADDFDMKKIVPTAPRAPLIVKHEEPPPSMKPVHEFVEPSGRMRHPNGERRRIISSESRRPLERPSEFQLIGAASEHPAPERIRKRIMKRRRKKPSTPQPEFPEDGEEKLTSPQQEERPPEEIQLNPTLDEKNAEVHQTSFFIDHSKKPEEEKVPDEKERVVKDQSILQTSFFIDHSKASEETKQDKENEVRQTRRKPVMRKPVQREPKPVLKEEEDRETVEESIRNENKILLNEEEEKIVAEPTIEVPKHEAFPTEITYEKEEIKSETFTPTTETPQEPTHRLKTLLKQQNGQLSLSELLQTQNLSLSDFLKGNPGALSALSANKVNIEKTTTVKPEPEKSRFQPNRAHIPKISSKSRPFSKQNNTVPSRRVTTTEEPVIELPKKLDIIEITTDRPYNGFAPKNPRTRTSFHGHGYKSNQPKEVEDDEIPEKQSNVKIVKDLDSSNKEMDKEKETESTPRSTIRPPVYRLTTIGQMRETSIGEQRVVPKRYGEYKPKMRVDRRKTTTDAPLDDITITEHQDFASKFVSTTEEIKTTQEPKNRVRIPFMSVNNPEISVILPSRKQNSTEKPKERFNMRERINLFKRITNDERSGVNENTSETKQTETTEILTTTTPLTTTTNLLETTETKAQKSTTKIMKPTISTFTTEKEPELERKETSDEIVELLKTGSNAQRLERILATRNMTLDELLEKRARTSKQPNVTHLFVNQTDSQLSSKEKVTELKDNHHPTSTTEKTTTTIRTLRPLPVFPEFTSYKNEHVAKIKEPKPIHGRHHQETNAFDELFVDESVIQPIKIQVDKEDREPKAYENRNKNSHRVQLNLAPGTEGKPKHPVPVWNVDEKSIYSRNPYGYPTYELNKNLAGHRNNYDNRKQQEHQINEEEIIVVQSEMKNHDSHQNLKHNINEILKEQTEVVKEIHNEEKMFIPPAVKSAIIASGVVMGIALVVFVAIFAACGWKQRQFRLRARSSILNDSLSGSGRKVIKRTGTLSPISFKRTALYKKNLEFEDSESSISGSSNTSSYLWNTLKHTFQSRNSTLKNREEKECKIQERESRSRRNTLTREDERSRRNTLPQEEHHRESLVSQRDPQEIPRRSTLTREDFRRDSIMSSRRDLSRDETRHSSRYREDNGRMGTLLRETEHCSFKKIDPERNIIQTSVNFKRGGFNGSSRHFDSCDHFN